MAASSLENILAQILGPKARVGYKLIVIGFNQILGYYIFGYCVCLTRLSTDNSVTNWLLIVEGLMAYGSPPAVQCFQVDSGEF